MLVATTYWQAMTLRRLDRLDEEQRILADIQDGMDVIENDSYYRLLKMAQGRLAPEELLAGDGDDSIQSATLAYGVGAWFLHQGDRDRAVNVFRKILEEPQWAAFGYLAAEAELARLGIKEEAPRQRAR